MLMKALTTLVELNNDALSHYGARFAVLSRFVDTALPLLTPSQRIALNGSFRREIEDVMALMDDVAVPAAYHSALLDQINHILNALSGKGTSPQ